jgi:YrbI family 3-deoxy-D-manno-octulosonate 8-phosphate phosphatase
MSTCSTLAIIPARGGSKGIPRKNLGLLAGRPLLLYSVESALQASRVDRVVVSTDDDEIAQTALAAGAEVVRRPAALAGDEASSESALAHVLDFLREQEGCEPERVVFLQATSPLRRSGDIDGAIEQFERHGADSLFSANPAHGFVWRRQGTSLDALTYDSNNRPRRQDIGEDFLENGSIYVFKPWVLKELGNRLGGKVAVYEMDPLDSFQVDEPGDFELMERLLAIPAARRGGPDLTRVRLLVLDFDGVLSDNHVTVHQDGTESVVCDRGDGLGLARLAAGGEVDVLVLSSEVNPVVAARCRKLRLPCHQGYDQKLPKLQELVAERGLDPSQVAYVGNDLNDLSVMGWCGVPIAVADAFPEVKRAAHFLTQRPGGRGAVREVCDLLLEQF